MSSRRFLILLTLLLPCSAAWGQKAPPNTPQKVSGNVTTSRGYLTAGAEGATYRTSSGYELRLAPATSLRFQRPTKLQLTISASTPTQVLELREGRVEIRSPSQAPGPQALMVTSPQKVMGVFTTGHGMVLASAGTVTVASAQGGMLVGVSNTWRPLPEGYARSVGPEDRAGTPRPIPGAPVIQLDSSLILSSGAAGGSAEATWTVVPDAVSYELTMVAEGGTTRSLTVSEPRAKLPDLDPGTYTVSLRAFDRHGLPGPSSQPRQIRVVRPVLPEGAYIGDDNAIRLQTHDRIHLAGAQGLYMTHGGADRFVPVSQSVGLFRGMATEIRLRDPQSSAGLLLDLVPQLHHASITFKPLRPRWPDEPVTIQVELYDGHSQPTAESVRATMDVTLNHGRISTEWKRLGNRAITTLKPASPLGPWWLKVKVSRPTGEIVGASSLRIDER